MCFWVSCGAALLAVGPVGVRVIPYVLIIDGMMTENLEHVL